MLDEKFVDSPDKKKARDGNVTCTFDQSQSCSDPRFQNDRCVIIFYEVTAEEWSVISTGCGQANSCTATCYLVHARRSS